MKKIMVYILGVMLLTSPVYAATENIPEGMGNKAIRGAIDLVTGIAEVPMQVYKGYDGGFGPIENTAGSKTVGTILGLFRGFGHAYGRMGSGAMELFGFWAANPESNEGVGVPFDAEYSWEMGEKYDMFDPSFSEGVKPIGRKLAHGLTDALLGIAELPGQTIMGASDGNVLKGIGKGFWYWWSREINGFGSVITSLVPNHPDTMGYAYEGKWAWSSLLGEE